MATLLHRNANGEKAYQIVLAPSSESEIESNDESKESVFSIQAEATVSAKDSSDITTCTEVDFTRDAEFSSEYELASSPLTCNTHPWSFHRNNSSGSSPTESVPNMLPTQNPSTTSRSSNCDVTSDDDNENKIVPYRIHYRFKYCAMCSKLNEYPSFPFCRSCYKIKKEFFPEKPRAKKKRKSKDSTGNAEHPKKRRKTIPIESIESTSSGLSNKRSINSLDENSIEEDLANSQETISADSGFRSQTNSDGLPEMVLDSDNVNDRKCRMCLKDEQNAVFIHGKIGHQGCCYNCAKRTWLDYARCPICKRKVSNIIRVM